MESNGEVKRSLEGKKRKKRKEKKAQNPSPPKKKNEKKRQRNKRKRPERQRKKKKKKERKEKKKEKEKRKSSCYIFQGLPRFKKLKKIQKRKARGRRERERKERKEKRKRKERKKIKITHAISNKRRKQRIMLLGYITTHSLSSAVRSLSQRGTNALLLHPCQLRGKGTLRCVWSPWRSETKRVCKPPSAITVMKRLET